MRDNMAHQTDVEVKIKRAAAESAMHHLDLALPYYFSYLARRRHENLQVGDYVRTRGLQKNRKFQLMDIYPQYGWVRVREVGGIEVDRTELGMPWHHLIPLKKKTTRSNTEMQAIGDWLFGRNLVYRLLEPDRILKQRKIHWDRQTCDVEDEDGHVFYDVPWDELEFVDDIEFHSPDESI
jgi:hypothetical protein